MNEINSLREVAYKNAYIATNNSEISSYVSDDIELIIKSMILNLYDCWSITFLWKKYKDQNFN